MNIDILIETYQARLDALEAEIDEINEWMATDFDPMDASGGNFDDAYFMGSDDGKMFGEFHALKTVIKDLKSLKEVD